MLRQFLGSHSMKSSARWIASLGKQFMRSMGLLTRRRQCRRQSAETFEDRVMLTAYVVNSLADGINVGGPGVTTLREALQAANTNTSVDGLPAGDVDGDVILFDSAVFGGVGATITLSPTLGELFIVDDVSIDGVTGSGGGTTAVSLSGGNSNRLFTISTNSAPGVKTSRITGLTLQDGDGTGTFSANDGKGGAIFINGTAQVTLDTVTIIGNSASGEGGGGIFNNGARLAISGSTFSNNAALGTSGSGGAVNSRVGLVTALNSTFSGNTANRAGGAIELQSGNFDSNNSIFDGNVAGPMGSANPGNGGALHVSGNSSFIFINGGEVTNNTAAREGGGLWNQAGSTMFVRSGALVSGNTASGNAADDGGGGIFNNGGTLTVLGATVSNNTATGAAGSGGGIFSTAGQVRVDQSTVSGNTAVRAGGGVEIVTGIFSSVGTDFTGNNALGSMTVPGNGGAMHVTGLATVTLTGGTVSGNTAALEGGGLWNSTGRMNVNNVLVDGNTASGDAADDGGGGIFNNGGRLAVTGSTLSNNIADGASGSGGGIFSTAGLVTVKDSTLSGNVANRAGGGVEIVDGNFDSNNSIFDGNVAGPMGSANPGNGGALHVSGNSSFIFINGGEVTNNTAAREGGGLWNQAGSTMFVRSGALVSGNTASGNAADDGGGGSSITEVRSPYWVPRYRITRPLVLPGVAVESSPQQARYVSISRRSLETRPSELAVASKL
ncbi:MAG: hypothetical protein R3C18_24650 [Planctomycetaceae bacterium]